MASRGAVSLFLVCVITAVAGAYTFDDIPIEYWAGSGSNEAVVVVDFGPASYAFGYRWEDGTKYRKDLMDAVDMAGALNYNQSGGFLNTISYGSYQNVGQNSWPTDWWAYFTGTDGVSWNFSGVGFADRILSNGSWDGWAHQTTDDWPPAHWPTTSVPEPITLTLLGIGGLLALKKSGKRHNV